MEPLWQIEASSLASLAISVEGLLVRVVQGGNHQAPVGIHRDAQMHAA